MDYITFSFTKQDCHTTRGQQRNCQNTEKHIPSTILKKWTNKSSKKHWKSESGLKRDL